MRSRRLPGRRVVDDSFLVMLNFHHEPMGFTLPAHRKNVRWEPMLDTREPTGRRRTRPYRGGQSYEMEARSVAVLRLRREDTDDGDPD